MIENNNNSYNNATHTIKHTDSVCYVNQLALQGHQLSLKIGYKDKL